MKIKSFIRNLNRARLLKRVCFYSFVFGCSLSAIIATVNAGRDYFVARTALKECFEQRIEAAGNALGQAVHEENATSARAQLSAISLACLDAATAQETVLWEIETQEGAWIRQGKTLVKGPELGLSYPLSYWDPSAQQNVFWLGDLSLTIRLNHLYQKFSWQALNVFLQQAFVLGLSALAGLLLGYQLFIRRARDFMARVRSHNVNEAMRHMVQSEQSEVAQLWKVILDLRDELEVRYQLAQGKVEKLGKERDRAVKDSEAKSQFLAKLSHELRTPMNGLLGFSALLLESKLDNEQREYAQTIQVSLESLLHVINDVLDLSRIESGDLNITSIPFSLRSVVSGVSSLLKNRAEAKGIHFDSRISPDVPQMLRGDPVRIRQILMNLVSNAIQHTEQGHVIINLEHVRVGDGEATVRISIEDTGLDPALRSKSVDELAALGVSPFSSELRERRSVGLDVCYQLAELMHATIKHESSPDKGTTFWMEITLPIVKQAGPASLINYSLMSELNVLVVDSYEVSRKITLELLQEWGVRFQAVASAYQALEIMKRNDIDAGGFNMILCDDLMQDLAGIEACRRFRQICPREIGLVVLCSNPQLGDAEGFFFAGANGFLSKQQRDPYLRDVMCQVYAERDGREGQFKRLVTRYTINDESGQYQEPATRPEGSRGRVLVVEDNIVNQQLATRLLEKKGFHVDVSANGFEAIELFKANTYLLVFMDCLMPDLDGYETTQIVREIEKSRKLEKRTPIIALTAHAIEGEAERCFQVGMDEFITKPFKLTQLEMVLDRYIQ